MPGTDNDTGARPAYVVESMTEATTRLLGRAIGMALRRGDTVLLAGELGAGKTRIVQGMAEALGVDLPARSPTFVLINEYRGRIRLFHSDLYRVSGPDEVADLGIDECLADGALAVEWPERGGGVLPQDALLIQIAVDPHSEIRTITMTPQGRRSANLAAQAMGVFDALRSAGLDEAPAR